MVKVTKADELGAAFATLVRERAGALLVADDPLFVAQREQLVALAASHAIPAMYFLREFAAEGGLMSYGNSLADAYHQVGFTRPRISSREPSHPTCPSSRR